MLTHPSFFSTSTQIGGGDDCNFIVGIPRPFDAGQHSGSVRDIDGYWVLPFHETAANEVQGASGGQGACRC